MRSIVTVPTRFGLPAVPSRKSRCYRCQAETWLSSRAELEPDDRVLCLVCAMSAIKPGDRIEPAPWVQADLADVEDLDP